MRRTNEILTVEATRNIVGEYLGKLTYNNSLMQEGLAEITDVSRLTIYKWESGKNCSTPLHHAKIVEQCESSMDYLVLGMKDCECNNEENQIGLCLLKRILNYEIESMCFVSYDIQSIFLQ